MGSDNLRATQDLQVPIRARELSFIGLRWQLIQPQHEQPAARVARGSGRYPAGNGALTRSIVRQSPHNQGLSPAAREFGVSPLLVALCDL